MFKVNIEKWIEKEIQATDLALLKAQDELLEAQLRVKGFEARLARLKGQQKRRNLAGAELAVLPVVLGRRKAGAA